MNGQDTVAVQARPRLRPDQDDFLARLRATYQQGRRWVLAQAATGYGKGHVIAEQVRRLWTADKRVLVVTHRRKLVSQLDERLDLFRCPHGVIMEGVPSTPGPVQVASRDTLYAMLEQNAPLPDADWLVIDEAHVACERILRHYRHAYGCGYSGTPCTSDGMGLGPPWQAVVCSIGARPLIDMGVLADVICYDPESVGRARQNGAPGRVVGGVIKHWRRYADGLPTLVFASRRSQGLKVCADYNAAGIPAEYVDGNTPDDERDAIYDRVSRGETTVLTNVNVVSVGVDIPRLTCVQFLRGVTSFVFFRQGAGRVMRAFPGKRAAVILDHAGAAHEFGLPTEDVDWDVDPGCDVSQRARARARQEGNRVVSCEQCGRQFSGRPDCPQCGWVIPVKKPVIPKLTEQGDGILTRYEGDADRDRARVVRQEALQRQWMTCLSVAAHKGQHFLSASAMFKRSTGRWPDECGVEPLPGWDQRRLPIRQVIPDFGKKGKVNK